MPHGIMGILNTRMQGIQNQVRNLQTIATTPKGIFESADMIVKDFRSANKATIRSTGIGKMLHVS